jgi:hypothetical protein
MKNFHDETNEFKEAAKVSRAAKKVEQGKRGKSFRYRDAKSFSITFMSQTNFRFQFNFIERPSHR